MQLLEYESDMDELSEDAALVMDTVLLIMRTIRSEMRRRRPSDLSVAQFRTLAFLNRYAGASLSDVADHVGLSLPSMSKLIDGLVARGYVVRKVSSADRRRVTLALTAAGRSTLQAVHQETQARLAELLATLSPIERAAVAQAMQALRPLFMSSRETHIT